MLRVTDGEIVWNCTSSTERALPALFSGALSSDVGEEHPPGLTGSPIETDSGTCPFGLGAGSAALCAPSVPSNPRKRARHRWPEGISTLSDTTELLPES